MKKAEQIKELDFISVLLICWSGKRLLIFLSLAFFLGAFFIAQKLPPERYVFKTIISSLPSEKQEPYQILNSTGVFGVYVNSKAVKNSSSQESLRVFLDRLFIESILQRDILKEAIIENKLIDVEDYANQETFEIAVERFINSVKLRKKARFERRFNELYDWQLEVTGSGLEEWMKVLEYVRMKTNEQIRKLLLTKFAYQEEAIITMREFQIETLKLKKQNTLSAYKQFMESKGSNPSEKSKNNGGQFYFLQNLSEIDNEIMLIERELSKIKMAVSLLKDSPVNSVDLQHYESRSYGDYQTSKSL